MPQGVTEHKEITEQRALVEGILRAEDDTVLLLQRSDYETCPGKWQPPAGKVKYGENPEDALSREFYEETGIDVEPVSPLDVRDYLIKADQRDREGTRHSIVISYAVDPLKPATADKYEVQLSEEHQDYEWMHPEEVSEDNMAGNAYDTIKQLDLITEYRL